MSFTPRLVALDIDGTLYTNVPATGQVEEEISPEVVAAVQRAYDAGAHVVLATGRSTFGIADVWDQLGLPRDGARVLSVASNGSVTFQYPPLEVLDAVTFDASEIVKMLMEHVPGAAVAVEEIGVGYRNVTEPLLATDSTLDPFRGRPSWCQTWAMPKVERPVASTTCAPASYARCTAATTSGLMSSST